MNELKPCPFCGGEMKTAVVTFDEKFYEPPYESWYLEHIDLNAAADECCPIPITDMFYETEAEAIEAWNTRADDYKQAAEYWQRMYEEAFTERMCEQEERGWGTEGDHARVWLTCGHDCMVPTVQDLPNYCPSCGAKVVSE